MLHTLAIENLKCGGCAATITKNLKQLPGVRLVSVDVENSTVNLDADDGTVEQAKLRLDQLGYPLAGTASGLHSAVATAKSYVSCAIGRVSG
jgi:copper chaperone